MIYFLLYNINIISERKIYKKALSVSQRPKPVTFASFKKSCHHVSQHTKQAKIKTLKTLKNKASYVKASQPEYCMIFPKYLAMSLVLYLKSTMSVINTASPRGSGCFMGAPFFLSGLRRMTKFSCLGLYSTL